MTQPQSSAEKGLITFLVVIMQLAGLLLIFQTVFVLPTFLEKKVELITMLQKTTPPAAVDLESNIAMKLLGWAALPSDFMVQYWYILLPLLSIFPVVLRRPLQDSAIFRLVLVGRTTSLFLAYAFFQSVAVGLGGAILLSYWKI